MGFNSLAVAGGMLLLAGCAAQPVEVGSADAGRMVSGLCRAEPGQTFVGQRASQATGAAILAETGASRLRWVPPGTMVTMDYVEGRVTVSYDADLRITRVSCG